MKSKMKAMDYLTFFMFIIVFVGIVGFFIINSYREKNLEECSIIVKAEVVERKAHRKKADQLRIQYVIDNEIFNSWNPTYGTELPGDSVTIKYACNKPKIIKLVD